MNDAFRPNVISTHNVSTAKNGKITIQRRGPERISIPLFNVRTISKRKKI